jgi:hypothetical protein
MAPVVRGGGGARPVPSLPFPRSGAPPLPSPSFPPRSSGGEGCQRWRGLRGDAGAWRRRRTPLLPPSFLDLVEGRGGGSGTAEGVMLVRRRRRGPSPPSLLPRLGGGEGRQRRCGWRGRAVTAVQLTCPLLPPSPTQIQW